MEKMLLNSGTTCLGAGVLALDPVPEEEVDGGGEDAGDEAAGGALGHAPQLMSHCRKRKVMLLHCTVRRHLEQEKRRDFFWRGLGED